MNTKILQIMFFALLVSVSVISAQQTVDFVTYGADANPNEGDYDFNQAFFIKVDKSFDDSLIVSLYDVDCSGKNDVAFNKEFNSKFKFSLYGGLGAFTSRLDSNLDSRKGELIKEFTVSNESNYDDIWIRFAILNKKQGEFVNGSYYFKLLVEGISGDDANVFNVRITNKNQKGIKIINYKPTIHLLPKMKPVQLKFNSRKNSSITVKNYDADGTRVYLQTPYRSKIKLKSSRNGNWKSDLIKLKKIEEDEICAVLFGPGGRRTNDAVFIILDDNENEIPINLPIVTEVSKNRLVIRKDIIHTDDCNLVVFDATKSYNINHKNITVKWVFPDGTVKRGLREEFRFKTAGKYQVVLAINDNSNSIKSGNSEKFNVVINSPPTAIAGDNILKAPNEKVYFNGKRSNDKDGWIKTYQWNFGDGNIGIGKKISHIYSMPGNYNVKLKVTDNSSSFCNSDIDSLSVSINASPKANAGNDIHCSIDEIINFDGSGSKDSDGNIILYKWNFGDRKKGVGKIVSHSFAKAGKYKVTLKVTDNSGVKNNNSTDNVTVWVNKPPIAKAGKDIEIAVDELITLDASNSFDKDGNIVEYIWSSSNQFKKAEKIFTHSFASPGKYEIKLCVKDNSGTNSEYAEDIKIITVNAKPIANAGGDRYQTNPEVLFDADKSYDLDGKIKKYHWNFGDGSSSNLKSVKHIYKNSGKYDVTLTVKDNSPASNNTATTKIEVTINAKPIADAGPNQVVAPNKIFNLSAKNSIDSDGTITSTKWFFNNVLISSKSDFEYSFNKSGSYDIQLRVADNSNHSEAIDFDNVTIIVNKAPVIVTDNYYNISVNNSVNFDASKSFDCDGNIKKYEWMLNNRVISNKAKFTYKFEKAGKYSINLNVTDNANVNNSISEKSIDVFVNSSPTIKCTHFINSCNNAITLSAVESFDQDGDILSFSWNLGDGTIAKGKKVTHNYNVAGSYPVLLTVDDGRNLLNSIANAQIIVKINSAPIANAGADEIICSGDIVTLDASKSYDADGNLLKYEWDFGDSTFANGITVNKNYNTQGLYTVKLKVTDNSGLKCNSSYDTKIIKVVDAPVAFAGEDIITCSGKETFFDAYKSTDTDGIVNSFSWDFGDGTVGGGEKTSHVYKNPGVYTVILTITGELTGNCDNVDTDELTVVVEEAPIAEFSYKDSVEVNSAIEFDASLSSGRGNKITNYKWDFGDGKLGDSVVVTHKFENAGTYIVKLSISTDSKASCNSSTIRKTVYVNDSPIAIAKNNSYAKVNEILTFNASKSYDPNGKITKYNWDFGDGAFDEGINVFHSYKKSGKYKITLTVKDETNITNNFATQELFVEVNSPPKGEIELPEYDFVGNPVLIGSKTNDVDGKVESVIWSIGELKDSTSLNFEHTFELPGKYDVMCEITDNKNAKTQLTKSIIIYALPQLTITANRNVCLNEKIKLIANYKIENSKIQLPIEWYMPNGKIITGKEISTKFSTAGNNKITVMLKHPNKKSDALVKKEIEISVNQPPTAIIADIKNAFIGGANDNILFDASESFDPDGNPLTYKWDMGDGIYYDGVKVFHTYLKSGTYKVTLTVSDNLDCDCSESVVSKKIKVINRK